MFGLGGSELATVEEVVGSNSVRRVNGLRTVTLGIIPPRNVALESGVKVVREDLIKALRDSGDIPPEISTTITGASTALEETRAEMGGNFLLAIVIAYLLMVAVFSFSEKDENKPLSEVSAVEPESRPSD